MFKVLYIILFVIATLLTVAIRPEVHKPMLVEDLQFNIEDVKKSDEEALRQNVQNTVQSIVQENIQPEVKTTSVNVGVRDTFSDDSANYRNKNLTVENQQPVKVTKTVNVIPQQTKVVNKNVKTQNPVNETEQLKKFERIMNESTKNPNKDLSLDEIETVVNVLTANSNPQPVAKPAKPSPVTTSTKPKQKVLTEQEEIIAWNIWRANLQNRVMRDSKVVAPLGTVFMFSCVVDKYGNISNINAWSTDPNYTASAKRNVKPALAALQGQSILRFPEGTRRNSTVVAGSFIMATSDRYASPNDYSDYERVR